MIEQNLKQYKKATFVAHIERTALAEHGTKYAKNKEMKLTSLAVGFDRFGDGLRDALEAGPSSVSKGETLLGGTWNRKSMLLVKGTNLKHGIDNLMIFDN